MMHLLKKALTDLQCELVAERNRVNPVGVTWLEYDILNALKRGSMLPSELSVVLGISRTKLSKNLIRLRELQYIEQVPNKQDHRELQTGLTSDGEVFLNTVDDGHTLLEDAAQKAFTQSEQQQLIELTSKLVEVLRKERLNIE
jgi:DNA-binding MarR family transcriptional regulator